MDDFLKREKSLFLQTYKRFPIDISHGEGVHLISKNGTRYLDFFSGLGVNVLGHAHPGIVLAIQNQAQRFTHLSNYFITNVQLEFAAVLLKHTNMSKVFLTNSGTEAVEAAIKLIRKVKGSAGDIFSLTNAFHGRTYGGLSLSDRMEYKSGFEPFLPGIKKVIFNDIDDLESKINEKTAAIVLEFIQGESGINIISNQFVEEIKKLKKQYKFMIVADCIQSGVGRTGKPFAFNHFNIEPDMILVAKQIGGGLPLGALLSSKDFDEVFSYGSHGTTFGGNPLSCTAGLVVLKEVFEKGLIDNVSELGNYFLKELKNLSKLIPDKIKDVRGIGFMIGVEMVKDCAETIELLAERNVLVSCTNKNVIRILPPFIAEKTDIDFFLYNFHEILKIKDQ